MLIGTMSLLPIWFPENKQKLVTNAWNSAEVGAAEKAATYYT
jgi:hypothetical protein